MITCLFSGEMKIMGNCIDFYILIQLYGLLFVDYYNPETSVMKKLSALILCLLIFTVSCDKEQINENFEDDSLIPNIDGKWKVVSFEDFEKGTITVKTDVDSWNGLDVIMTFAGDSLWGYCTTNSMTGKYSLSGRRIHIINYVGTKIAQPVWGSMFSKIFYDLESFRINEHQLRFYFDDSRKSVTLSRD
jgi:hypothetical protein